MRCEMSEFTLLEPLEQRMLRWDTAEEHSWEETTQLSKGELQSMAIQSAHQSAHQR